MTPGNGTRAGASAVLAGAVAVIVLAGDIGGTHARLALVDTAEGRPRVVDQRVYPSPKYPGLAPIVRQFQKDVTGRPEAACFGVAGPVTDGADGQEVRTRNLPWTIQTQRLAADIGIPETRVVNDFTAAGYGIAWLVPADLVVLQDGRPDPHGVRALIGAGTGLGQGFLVWDGVRYRDYPSEGGHADFAARSDQDLGLLQFLRAELGHVSTERVLSGPGLGAIYRYLAAGGAAPEAEGVRSEMRRGDPAAVVTRHALAGTDRLCERALDVFVDAFAAQAGDLALTVLATGGVYLTGGIAPRIVQRLREGRFVAAFRDKGRMADFMVRIPVQVVMNEHVGLLGSAAVAAHLSG